MGDANGAATDAKRKSLRTLYLPNTSPVPNFVFDELLSNSEVPHAAIRVLLFMLRKTLGWSNRSEELSLSDIQGGASVSRPVAIHTVRVICECWGLFHKSRGRRGQHSSVFTIADLTLDAFNERAVLVEGIYGTLFPSPNQLRERPCTSDVLAEERLELEAERAAM